MSCPPTPQLPPNQFQISNIITLVRPLIKALKISNWCECMYPMYIKPQVWCCPTNRATHKDFMLVPTPNVPNYHSHWIYLTKLMSCPEKDKCCIENINPHVQRCVMCNMYMIICIYICIDIYRQYLQLFTTFYWCLNNIVSWSYNKTRLIKVITAKKTMFCWSPIFSFHCMCPFWPFLAVQLIAEQDPTILNMHVCVFIAEYTCWPWLKVLWKNFNLHILKTDWVAISNVYPLKVECILK